jgi:hypothetical protein
MVPDPAKSSLGLEYFCSEGDELWNMTDDDLVSLGRRELERIGLVSARDIEDGCVFRVPKAYPIYDTEYREYLTIVKDFVSGLQNYQTIGRNGLHRYNNQDHAMLTGMLAVRNVILGEKNDLWNVNADQEYHEEIQIKPSAERQHVVEALEGVLTEAFLKLDRQAFGLSLGIMSGLVLAVATIFLTLKGGESVGANLSLLIQFFPGYSVTTFGSILGLFYGFLTGFILGWGFAFLRNTSVFLYMAFVRRQAEWELLRKVAEYL